MKLSYMEKALALFTETVHSGRHITIYGDYDVDGLTCLLQFKTFFSLIDFTNYDIVEYTQRTHSIDPNLPSILLQNRSGLCIICDSGCGEPETLKYLNSLCPVIVLDHHRGIISTSDISDSLVVVNPSMWNDGVMMSAGCVTYELLLSYIEEEMYEDYDYFKRMLSFYPFLSLYADGAYGPNDYCFRIYHNAQDAVFPLEFSFAQKNFISTKRFVLFSVAPPINAAFRNNRLDLINKLFLSKEPLLTYERADLLDELENLRSRTRKYINQLEAIVQPRIVGEFALVDLTGYLNQSINNEVIWANKGLIANKIADRYKCACVCIVNTGNEYSVSVRDYYGRDVLSLMQTFYEVGGHPSAFGGTIETRDVLYLHQNLLALSRRLEKPKPRRVLNMKALTTEELETIALQNEFKHPNQITVVSVAKMVTKLEPTPASWEQKYYQYHIKYGKDSKLYVKQEDYDSDEYSTIHIQLYKGKRLMGAMVQQD